MHLPYSGSPIGSLLGVYFLTDVPKYFCGTCMWWGEQRKILNVGPYLPPCRALDCHCVLGQQLWELLGLPSLFRSTGIIDIHTTMWFWESQVLIVIQGVFSWPRLLPVPKCQCEDRIHPSSIAKVFTSPRSKSLHLGFLSSGALFLLLPSKPDLPFSHHQTVNLTNSPCPRWMTHSIPLAQPSPTTG